MAPVSAPSPHRTTALPVTAKEEMKMTKNNHVVVTTLFLTFASLGQAGAADVSSGNGTRQSYDVLSVVGAAYHDAGVATNVAEVRRQGGFATAGTVRWKAAPDRSSEAAVIDVPSVIGAAYHDARVATNVAEVRRQGGFAIAGAVRWTDGADRPVQGTVFDMPSVIGAAYHDPRIATNAAEVRRQGGLATAGAVRWLPAAPVPTDARLHRVRVGAL
jgi:hypothetical protein